MASHGHQMLPQAVPRHAPNAAYGAPPMAPANAPPAGTFAPGTKIQVGSHRVLIQKYLSEGGFAHVYLVKLPKPVDGTDMAVLKRVAVPDKDELRSMRIEVETMKRLKGHRPIVTYIDSHASEMRGGGYEVFLLMEYCNGGGLIDFMNTRLQHRLTEPEIINVIGDIAEGVACMHYLKPPLLHRDIKVENVLITSRASSKRFKLCDFGSASPPRPAPTTVVECRLMDEDVQKHTTLQYRSPEMVDVYRKQPMNEKSDIWALGVLLYKLCYYTTPFEDQGQLAILNASFRYPSHPVFSDRLKKLIAVMLKESMQARPNIYQVLKEICAMQGRDVPIQDIYAGRPESEARGNGSSTSSQKIQPKPIVGAIYSPPKQEQQAIPDIVPMRRGRPTASSAPGKPERKPDTANPKVGEGDPFAALDRKTAAAGSGDVDELSSRFPSLSQFSLLHDQGSSFDFDPSSPTSSSKPTETNDKIAEKLADAAFISARQSAPNSNSVSRPPSVPQPVPQSRIAASPSAGSPRLRPLSVSPNPEANRIPPVRDTNLEHRGASLNPRYVSTGTWTGDMSSGSSPRDRNSSSRNDAAELSRTSSLRGQASAGIGGRYNGGVADSAISRVSSLQGQSQVAHDRQPSLDRTRAKAELQDATLRPIELPTRQRPASTNFESSTLEFLREKEASSRPHSRLGKPSPNDSPRVPSPSIDYITKSKSHSSQGDTEPDKRFSLQPTPGKLAGKFGDAFQRFETNAPLDPTGSEDAYPSPERPEQIPGPIPQAKGKRVSSLESDDDSMTPEQRREIERLALEQEEQRVEAAQAEYRKRVADGGPGAKPIPGPKPAGGAARASSIQNRVQSLLSEEQQPSVQRTAQGYGKYTDSQPAGKPEKPLPTIPRKPLGVPTTKLTSDSPSYIRRAGAAGSHSVSGISSASPAIAPKPTGKPTAPKKPVHLNSFPTGAGRPSSPDRTSRTAQQEQLVAADLPGQPVIDMSAKQRDDYIEDFSKRFPSLSAIEMEPSDGGHRRGMTRG